MEGSQSAVWTGTTLPGLVNTLLSSTASSRLSETASCRSVNPLSVLLSSLELSDTQVYSPYIRARLGTAVNPPRVSWQSAAVVRRGLALVLGVVPPSSAPLLAARVLQSIAHQRTHSEVLLLLLYYYQAYS